MEITKHSCLYILEDRQKSRIGDIHCRMCNIELQIGDEIFSKHQRNGHHKWYHSQCARKVGLIS